MKKNADDLINDIVLSNAKGEDGIVYLIANLDKLKYLSLGNKACDRREAIIKHVSQLYPGVNRSQLERILSKNFIFSENFYFSLNLLPAISSFLFSLASLYTIFPDANYDVMQNPLINFIGIIIFYILPSFVIAIAVKLFCAYIICMTNCLPRVYFIKSEYKDLGIPNKPLFEMQ